MEKLILRSILFLLIFTFLLPKCISQSCYPYGLALTSQTEIDSFPLINPNCTEIAGSFIVQGEDITNLNGLSNLSTLSGGITIADCPRLRSLSGLENVDSINGSLILYMLDSLLNLEGLKKLPASMELIHIMNCNALANLNGLENLTYINELYIQGNEIITKLSGLKNLESVGNSLFIESNPKLNSLASLINLLSIEGNFTIMNNDQLQNLDGLTSLNYLGGSLIIRENQRLSDIADLSDMEVEELEMIRIYANPNLSVCEINSICDFIEIPNSDYMFYLNASGCGYNSEVENACQLVSSDELIQMNKYLIYPNPATDKLFIQSENNSIINEASIFDQMGRRWLRTIDFGKPIPITSLPKGLYLIEIRIDKTIVRKVFVKN